MARRGSNEDADEDSYGEESVSDDAEGGLESELQTEAEVTCPFCGESMAIVLDAGGGTTQEYVEDCQVCCRPWIEARRAWAVSAPTANTGCS